MAKELEWSTQADWDQNNDEKMVEHQGAHPTSVVPTPVPLDGLVGYWPGRAGEGTTLYDQSPNANHGTFVNSPRWQSGPLGNSIKYDKADGDYIKIPHIPEYDITDKISIALWFRHPPIDTTSNNDYRFLFTRAGSFDPYSILIEESGSLTGSIYIDGNRQFCPSGNNHFTPDTWFWVLLTYDGTSGEFTWYIDGDRQRTDTKAAGSFDTSLDPIYLGHNGRVHVPDGQTAEHALWNRIITADEAATIYDRYTTGWNASITTSSKQ